MKLNNIIILFLALFVVVSCNDELELQPAQSLSTSEALADIDGMETALIGAYDLLQAVGYYGREMVVMPEIEADLAYLSINNSNRFVANYTYQWDAQNGDYTDLWNLGYRAILRVNNVINNIDALEGDADKKNVIKGEALAIRALAHFDLVRWFAKQYTNSNPSSDLGVPIILTSEITEPSRNTISEVFDQVIADLNAAKGLTSNSSIYRFSTDAVNALLARVYLYKGDWANAESAASAVINSGKYSLVTDFATMFAGPGSSEEIFTLNFQAAENNGSDNLGGIYNPDVYGDIRVSEDLLSLYVAEDDRLNVLYVHTNNEVYQGKFLGQDGIAGLASPKILRLSEMYLIRAEARANGSNAAGALADINALRVARGAPEFNSVSLSVILDERRRELAFEGHTLFDLWRTKTDMVRGQCNTGLELRVDECTISASSPLAVHPIPQREIDVNQNMVQNPGYN